MKFCNSQNLMFQNLIAKIVWNYLHRKQFLNVRSVEIKTNNKSHEFLLLDSQKLLQIEEDR